VTGGGITPALTQTFAHFLHKLGRRSAVAPCSNLPIGAIICSVLSDRIDGCGNNRLSILSKRRESGTFEKLTRSTDVHFEIDSAELAMMLRRVQIERTIVFLLW
jgi:hypothetical protein